MSDLTIRQEIEVREPCRSPVMIEWLNSLGKMDVWLFEHRQELDIQTQPGELYEFPLLTLDTNETHARLKGDAFQTMTLFAERLTEDQVRALAEIKASNLVYQLKQDGTRRRVVPISDFSTAWNTRATKYNFTVKLRFPEILQ